jgi:hypothetical protein
MSASSSTLTVKGSLTPQARKIPTAFAENPHCGKSGVPFM